MLLPFWTGTDSAGTPGGLGLGRQVAWPQAEPWGTLQPVGDGIWAMLSTPLVDRKTLCNGGIIAGRDGVLMVEAFGSDDGARWMRERARELTRREPTQVLLTHYHADHAGGLRAAREADAELWCTARTRDDVATRNQGAPAELLPDATVLPQEGERVLDLGGRRVRLLSLDGHTASDVVAVVEDAGVVFAGDLVWYGMFPNFVDAQPSRLTRAVRALRALDARVYVSGHGQTTDTRGVDAYIGLLDLVERAARDAQAAGRSAAEAAADFRMPPQMADWTLFNPRYFERAIGAWLTELSPS
jgi:glyoxylase-like metal-dependent hydrolase (beta-lactamase superfamily II)